MGEVVEVVFTKTAKDQPSTFIIFSLFFFPPQSILTLTQSSDETAALLHQTHK